jgi:hypothetical protein
LFDGADGGRRDKALEAIGESQGATDADEARKPRGDLARLETLDGALRHAGLFGEGRLGEVAGEPRGREAAAEFAEDGLVGEAGRDANKSPNRTNRSTRNSLFVCYDE